MPLVPCICTSCGAPLEVDDHKEAAVCKFCGTPFIVEKAINIYKTTNITMASKDPEAIIRHGLTLMMNPLFNEEWFLQAAKDLSLISKDEFYTEFFYYIAGAKFNEDWLLKNADSKKKKELINYLFNAITKDYNKESFADVKLNILKNYSDVPYNSIGNDKTHGYIVFLDKLKDSFGEEDLEKWNKLCSMADSELSEIAESIKDVKTALLLAGYSKEFSPIVSDSIRKMIEEKVSLYASENPSADFMDLYTLAKITNNPSCFHLSIGPEIKITYDKFIYRNTPYPLSYVHEYFREDETLMILLQLDETTATVIKTTGDIGYSHAFLFPNLKMEGYPFFSKLISYKTDHVDGSSLRLVYKNGISYKKSLLDSALGFFTSILK